ncbi:MAG TPA: fructosamine kinase family protein [Kofleriaceae bacterium]|nr:fructosamine kinase family protein [Kofleriaceae bacterium]
MQRAVGEALGSVVVDARSIGGGCINEAAACTLADGRRVFVKHNPGADPRMFPAEARGLAWLAEPGALRVPTVLAVSDPDADVSFIALELLEPGRPAADHDVALGRGLATLHRAAPPCFGLDHDNFLATLEQSNTASQDWPTFYAEQRLAPQVRLAVDHGHAPHSWLRDFDRLCQRLPELAGPPEPPARLHGDLWSGNLHRDPRGAPALIDPAVYGGHREIDLAMLTLFGSPGPRVFAAYHDIYPLDPAYPDRVGLYQLYPLLAHVNLFGASYVPQVAAALRPYL